MLEVLAEELQNHYHPKEIRKVPLRELPSLLYPPVLPSVSLTRRR
jgi:hypothetical protein